MPSAAAIASREFVGAGCVLSMADHLYSPRVVDAVLSPEFAEGSCVLGVDYDIPRCFDLDDATKVRVENQRIVEISKSLSKKGAGAFTLPGLCKIVVQHKPAQPAKKGVPNPFKPGELMDVAAKPAKNVVKVRALKKLKDMV